MKKAFSGKNLFLLSALSLGHMLTHCYQQGWYILMPAVKGTFGLSDIKYGAIESTRSAANAAVLMPAGFAADMLHKQWVIASTGGLVGFGVAYLVLALAPSYGLVLLASMILGIGMALWHPSALSVLSYRLASRRGLALSLHGMGGNIGNAVGPAMVGILIGAVAWQTATWMLAIPLILLSLMMWIALRKITGVEEGHPSGAGQYFSSLLNLLRNRVMLTLVICNSLRAMGTVCVFAFFALYLSEDLGFSPAKVGFYYMLMMASGIASQPVLGHLSDRWGRRAVMIPSMSLLGLLQILIGWSGSGAGLALVAVGAGLFIYAVSILMQAAVMDVTPPGAGGATIALLMGSAALFQIPSPTIAGWLSENYGTQTVFLYSGSLVLVSALLLMLLPEQSFKRGGEGGPG